MVASIVITSGATHFHYDVSRFVDFQIFNLKGRPADNDFDFCLYVEDNLVIRLNYEQSTQLIYSEVI
jgi:hypothetical protein